MARKDDSGYVAQLEQQKSKKWYYQSAHRHRVKPIEQKTNK